MAKQRARQSDVRTSGARIARVVGDVVVRVLWGVVGMLLAFLVMALGTEVPLGAMLVIACGFGVAVALFGPKLLELLLHTWW